MCSRIGQLWWCVYYCLRTDSSSHKIQFRQQIHNQNMTEVFLIPNTSPAPLTSTHPPCTLRWKKIKSPNPWGLVKQPSSSSERGILISHCYQRRRSVTASKPSPWTLRWAERHTAADSTQVLTIKPVRETQRRIKAERRVCSFWLALERER